MLYPPTNPLKCNCLVLEANVPESLRSEGVEEAENTHAIRWRHHDHVPGGGHVLAVVVGVGATATELEPAAVEHHHDSFVPASLALVG